MPADRRRAGRRTPTRSSSPAPRRSSSSAEGATRQRSVDVGPVARGSARSCVGRVDRRRRRRSCRAAARPTAPGADSLGPLGEVAGERHAPDGRGRAPVPPTARTSRRRPSRSNSSTPMRRSSSARPCDSAEALTPTRSRSGRPRRRIGDGDEVLELSDRDVGERQRGAPRAGYFRSCFTIGNILTASLIIDGHDCTTDRSRHRQARRPHPRHGRRGLHLHRRCHRRPQGHCIRRSARSARWRTSASAPRTRTATRRSGVRAAGRTRRHRVRRLGPDHTERHRSRPNRRRARQRGPRHDLQRDGRHRPDGGRVRPALGVASRRRPRQGHRQQVGPGDGR